MTDPQLEKALADAKREGDTDLVAAINFEILKLKAQATTLKPSAEVAAELAEGDGS